MAFDISESSRNVFAKNEQFPVELDDKRLLNALARFDKTDDSKPELDDALNSQGNRARTSKGGARAQTSAFDFVNTNPLLQDLNGDNRFIDLQTGHR